MDVRDKVIVVTGGASGIGRAMAERFHAEGAKKVVVADLDGEGAQQVAGLVDGWAQTVDVSNESQIVSLIEETVSVSALSQEYIVEMNGPNGPESHRVLGVLCAAPDSPGLLSGERIWGSEKFLRQMIGPIWDELEPIEG